VPVLRSVDGWKQLEEKASASRLECVAGRLMDAINAVQHAAANDVSELRGLCDAKADATEFEQLKFGMVRFTASTTELIHAH
jgi:hypothetical protein